MKGWKYKACVLCGRKAVAPFEWNPIRYAPHGICPKCCDRPDFDKVVDDYDREHGLKI